MRLEVDNRHAVAMEDMPLVPESAPRLRHWKLWTALVVIAVILVLLGVGGVKLRGTLISVQAEANLGKSELLAGANLIKKGGVGLSTIDAGQAGQHFRSSEAHFQTSSDILTHSRLINMVGLVPGIDRQVAAGRRLADMGVHLSRAGGLGVQALGVLSSKGPKQGPGEKILAVLDAIDPKLDAISGELRVVEADRSAIPATGLLPPVRQAVVAFDSKFKAAEINSLVAGVRTNEPVLRQILGVSVPRTYLVLQQDPAELRGTGGFIGTVGFLSFDKGHMAPFTPEDVYNLDQPNGVNLLGPPGTASHVDAPYPLVKIFNLQSWTLRDSNWSPDFPTAAKQGEYLLDRETHRQVDGVIAIDPYFISKLLAVIGPTTVPETGDVVTAANFYATTLQRVHPESGPAVGKSFLSEAANAIFGRLLAAPSSDWAPLAQAIQTSCGSRSLQAYFNDTNAENFIGRSDCSVRVQPVTSDALTVVESNVGGNKDDFWMQRRNSLRLAVQPDGSVQHTLVLHYSGLTAHGPPTGTWGYTGWLRVYLPTSSSIVSVSGASLDDSSELGRQLLQGWFYVQFGATQEITIVYRTDAAGIHATSQHLELLWQKQAGRLADPISVELTLPPSWRLVKSDVNHGTTGGPLVKSDLSVDRDFQFWFQPS